ncbi:MAG: phospholipase D-like domain-containing protein, partial [Dysgonamonadaceae bacterium]|nr:phospholipase D-like domain-containing protein [Dysgonamonadaceae bacterium]
MSSKFFTNQAENTLINKFEGVISNNPDINCFDAMVGYLRASGYFEIQPFLYRMGTVRILAGINADKFIADAQAKGILYFGNPEQAKEDFLNSVKKDIENSDYSEIVENGILQFIDDIIRKKIEVRAHPSKKIHAKIYILYPRNFNEHTLTAAAITGSSNLSGYGLGIGNDRQYEFNVLLNENTDVQFAKNEFEQRWQEAEGCDILPTDIGKARQETYLAGDVTPYEMYVKMLIEYFGEAVSYKNENPYELPENFRKMEYQIDAAEDGYRKMLKYDGFFLSDVVGLGKTVIAAMIAKRYVIENGLNNTKILVVYPPALEKNWKSTFAKFSLDKNTKFVSTGSLSKVLDIGNDDYWNADEYDLVLVDESHKFRNHKTAMFRQLQEICKCPRINTGRIDGRKKKIMLISATPLNNSPEDIYYQILLFQNPRQSTLNGAPNLTAFFAPKTAEYKKLKSSPKLDIDALKQLYEEIRERVIKPITVRRTRRDIEKTKRFAKDVEEFPKVQKPIKIEYQLDDELTTLFDLTVLCLIEKLNYSRYQAIASLKPEIQNRHYEKAELVSKSLAFIVKTLLIKRLESSFYAFRESLERFQTANLRMIEMFDKGKVYIAPDLDLNKFYDKGLTEEEIEEEITKAAEENSKNRIFKPDDFNPEFIKQLIADRQILDDLTGLWKKIGDTDPKLAEFLNRLDKEFFDKEKNIGQKLVVFSESTDTIEYLQKHIKRNDVLTVSAKNRTEKFAEIEENFDANIKPEDQKNDYNIILSTEALAEGVNLHRSNIIINYDTPWNSTRLMQRIGRVNRIGSVAKNIYNYVFYPSTRGNAQINLINNSLAKIQAFHTAFGEDNQIYSTDEIVDLNLSKLFEEGLPEEELNREFQYLEEIRELKAHDPKEYKRIENLSLRCRTGRCLTEADTTPHDASLVFLKTDKIKSFFLVNNETIEELSALQAIDLFKADKVEPRAKRIPDHHKHVKAAEQKFKAEIQSAYNQQSSVIASGKHVTTALAFIRRHRSMVE